MPRIWSICELTNVIFSALKTGFLSGLANYPSLEADSIKTDVYEVLTK